MEKESILKALQTFGLQEKEAAIYLQSLHFSEPASAGKLAKFTDINRGTAYYIVKELSKKGFLKEIIINEISFYTPLPLAKLQDLILQEEKELKLKKILLEKTAKEFKQIVKKKDEVSRIKYFNGPKAIIDLYQTVPVFNYHYCMFSADAFASVFPHEKYYGFGSLDLIKRMQGRMIFNDIKSIAHKKMKNMVSVIPKVKILEIDDCKIQTDTMIFDDS